MMMRPLLILAAIICFSTFAFAQTGPPKAGGKPVKEVKPAAPMSCKLVGTVRGTKLWAGECAAAQNFAVQPPPLSPRRLRQHPKQIPPPLTNNRHSTLVP
jgi:hypothetical protein